MDRIFLTTDRSPSPASFVSSSTDSITVEKERIDVPLDVAEALRDRGFDVDYYGVVRWQENSAAHPRKWPVIRKAYDTAIICFLEFFMTLVSNTGSSVAMEAAVDFRIGRVHAIGAFTTIYLIGQAVGGLVLPPICEAFGGRMIYVTSTFAFAVFSALIGIWPVLPVVVVFRFLTGALAAMPAVVAAGSLENLWCMKARTFAIHSWISSAVVGLATGPAIATYVSTSQYGWRWIFYGSAVIAGFSAFLCLFMSESRPSRVIRQRVKSVVHKTSFDSLSVEEHNAVPDMRTTFLTPVRLFFGEPIIFLTSIMAATVYGVTYLFSEAFTVVYKDGYGFTTRQASLVSLTIAVGVPLTFLPRIYDIHIANRCAKQNRTLEPEHKLFGFYIAAPILAIGLWWFALTVDNTSPWVSITSLILFGFALVEFDNVLSGYITDTYASYAASANSPMAFLRAILSGVFPLCGEQMFSNLGASNALFLHASLATAYCGVAVLFWKFGKRIRESSPFAEKTWAASQSSEELLISYPASDPGSDIEAPKGCYVRC